MIVSHLFCSVLMEIIRIHYQLIVGWRRYVSRTNYRTTPIAKIDDGETGGMIILVKDGIYVFICFIFFF